LDVNEYLEMFVTETEEHLETFGNELIKLEKNPKNIEIVNEIFRAAHTIKGMAGSMGFTETQNVTHRLEDLLGDVRSGKRNLTTKDFDFLFDGLDLLERLLSEIKNNNKEASSAESLVKDQDDEISSGHLIDLHNLTEIERITLEEVMEGRPQCFYCITQASRGLHT